MKQYNKSNIPLAKNLRKNMTPWERKLWYEYLRDYPIRFQRQKALGESIVDFYCAKAKLVIELDGGGHYEPEQAKADALRTQRLETMGLRVLRICNLDIDRNFRGVCEQIDIEVQNSLPQSASLTAPSSEGAFLVPTIILHFTPLVSVNRWRLYCLIYFSHGWCYNICIPTETNQHNAKETAV